ncbi:hypothetical protein MBLNU457_g2527t1 [Dothideomycetes sp. NU457]
MSSLLAPSAAILAFTTLTTAFQALPLQSYILPLPPSISTSLTTAVGTSPLDGVYITSPSTTSYEIWSFSAVATDLSASIVLHAGVNYSSSPALSLALQISVSNGTLLSLSVPGSRLFVSTLGEGSKAIASDGSYGWWSRPEIGEYEFEVRLPEQGVQGRVRLQSVAPPHVSCGPAVEGASLALQNDMFWSNIIPDAVAQVDLSLRGERMGFLGNGFHDKTWGSSAMPSTIQYSRGHGRAGQWSVVWYHGTNTNAAKSTSTSSSVSSIYIARQGEIVYASCTGVEVTEITDPGPSATGMNSTGYRIEVDAGQLGRFEFVARPTRRVGEECFGSACSRYIGEFQGGFVEGGKDVGVVLWETSGT